MAKKLANDFVQTNAEYEKLKNGTDGNDQTPRETPSGQAPGRAGYDKQRYAQWTREELFAQAERLKVPDAERLSRDELIEALEGRDATQARLGS